MHWAKTLLGVDETDAELLFLASLIDIYGTRSCSVVAGIATTKTLCKARYMLFFKSIFDGVLKVELQAVRKAATICPRPLQVDLWPFDLESGVRVTCDVGYLSANFSHTRPLCSRLRPDVRDRQTDVRLRHASSLNASALWGRGHNNGL